MTLRTRSRSQQQVLKAGPGRSAAEKLKSLAAARERRVQASLIESFRIMRERVTLTSIQSLIEDGRFSAVSSLWSPQVIEDSMRPFRQEMIETFMQAGRLAASLQPSVRVRRKADVKDRGDTVQAEFTFNATNPKISSVVDTQVGTRIRQLGIGVRETIQNVIREEVSAGRNPRATARRIKETIGLTNSQKQSVTNYSRALRELDRSALDRMLRDRRFDSTIRNAIESGVSLSSEQQAKMITRYRERLLKHRAETIARTESIRAVSGAQHAMIQDHIDRGVIDERQVRRFWHFTHDERTRMEHRRIPDMNRDGVGQNEPFQTPLGPLMYPADPRGFAENVINCRCAVFPRVISAELLDLPEPQPQPAPAPAPKPAPAVSDGNIPIPSSPTTISGDPARSSVFDIGDISKENRDGLIEYQSGMYGSQIGGYQTIQQHLRTGATNIMGNSHSKDKIQDYISRVDQALDQSTVQKDTRLFRGVTKTSDIFGKKSSQISVGDTYVDKAFTSTASNRAATKKFTQEDIYTVDELKRRTFDSAVIEVDIPKGFKALPIDKVAEKVGEFEVLLPRNIRWEVVSVRRGAGLPVIRVRPREIVE